MKGEDHGLVWGLNSRFDKPDLGSGAISTCFPIWNRADFPTRQTMHISFNFVAESLENLLDLSYCFCVMLHQLIPEHIFSPLYR